MKTPNVHERKYFAKAVQLLFEPVRGFLFHVLYSRKGTMKEIEKTLGALLQGKKLESQENHVRKCLLGQLKPGEELNEDDFDNSLIYNIIRNAYILDASDVPTKGYGKEPEPADQSLGDDVERCRILRNKLCHKASASMTKRDFDGMVKDVKDILHRWSNETGTKFLDEVDKVVNSDLTLKEVNEAVDKFIADVKRMHAFDTGDWEKIKQTNHFMVCFVFDLNIFYFNFSMKSD